MITFVDAGILILGARGKGEFSERALAVLSDPRRRFVASRFLQLEVLPKPSYFHRSAHTGPTPPISQSCQPLDTRRGAAGRARNAF